MRKQVEVEQARFIEDTYQVGFFEEDDREICCVYRPDGKNMPKLFRADGTYWRDSIAEDGPESWVFDDWRHAKNAARELNEVWLKKHGFKL